jgi:hypothetical protein
MEINDIVPSDSPVPDDERDGIYERMCDLWGLKRLPSRHNPCALAVPLTRTSLRGCDPAEYLVTLKTDGVRFLLLLTRLKATGRDVAVMIGRDMSMWEIQVWAPSTFFERGTLLDGELAWCQGQEQRLRYFAFDAMCVEGARVGRKPLVERLQALRQCLYITSAHRAWVDRYIATEDEQLLSFITEENKIVPTPNNVFGLSLQPKHMLQASVLASPEEPQWEDGAIMGHVDGLVFTPRSPPVYVGTHRTMFKWKPTEHQTIDFQIRAASLWLDVDGAVTPVEKLCGLACHLTESAIDDGVYECQLSLDPGGGLLVTPRRLRADKQRPNARATAEGVVQAIEESIGRSDLAAWAAGDPAG